jgi:hypothetical protein
MQWGWHAPVFEASDKRRQPPSPRNSRVPMSQKFEYRSDHSRQDRIASEGHSWSRDAVADRGYFNSPEILGSKVTMR